MFVFVHAELSWIRQRVCRVNVLSDTAPDAATLCSAPTRCHGFGSARLPGHRLGYARSAEEKWGAETPDARA